MNNCISCLKETNNPKFCSKSCAAKHNNKIYKKRHKKQRLCRDCCKPIENRTKVCRECNKNFVDWSTITYQDMKGRRKYQQHSRIRELARTLYLRSGQSLLCPNCHWELDHQLLFLDSPFLGRFT